MGVRLVVGALRNPEREGNLLESGGARAGYPAVSAFFGRVVIGEGIRTDGRTGDEGKRARECVRGGPKRQRRADASRYEAVKETGIHRSRRLANGKKGRRRKGDTDTGRHTHAPEAGERERGEGRESE